MIKIFRRVKLNLLSEGKTGKYFKYALGEILLVMIGILLAIQVNNWNETSKQSKKELVLLANLKNDVNADIMSLTRNDSTYSKLKNDAEIGMN